MNCVGNTKIIEYFKQMGAKECSPSYRRDGLVVKIRHKSNVLELFTVSNGDLLAGLAIPGPKVLHGYHIRSSFTLSLIHI